MNNLIISKYSFLKTQNWNQQFLKKILGKYQYENKKKIYLQKNFSQDYSNFLLQNKINYIQKKKIFPSQKMTNNYQIIRFFTNNISQKINKKEKEYKESLKTEWRELFGFLNRIMNIN